MRNELEVAVISNITEQLMRLNFKELLRVRRYLEMWLVEREEEMRTKGGWSH